MTEKFRSELLAVGIPYDGKFLCDGKIHRCHLLNDKSGQKSFWYVLFQNGPMVCGSAGSWKNGVKITLCSQDSPMLNQQERKKFQAQIKNAQHVYEVEKQRVQQITQKKAKVIWESSKPAPDNHPYLLEKRVPSYGLKLSTDNQLITPLYAIDGVLHSLQFIDTAGSKRFLGGGKYVLIGG